MLGNRIAYAACMLLATVCAAWMLKSSQRPLGLTGRQRVGIAIGGMVGATFAAKLPFILGADPSAGVLAAWMSDGKTILWGLTGGYLGVELSKWSLHIRQSTGDTFVVAVAVAVGIGRLGCLLYGCCYGVATNQSWGLRFQAAPDAGVLLRHPTQLYELVFHFTFALLAWVAISQPHTQPASRHGRLLAGNWMPLYLLSYSLYRFASEFWRPELTYLSGLTFYQWSSVGIGVGFTTLLAYRGCNTLFQHKDSGSSRVTITEPAED